jgi:predicted transcriptional regulator
MKNLQLSQSFENRTQLQIVFEYLQSNVATASMVAKATGVSQKNICRYKRKLEKASLLWEVYNYPCKETGRRAWFLTTNRSKTTIRSVIQLQLF